MLTKPLVNSLQKDEPVYKKGRKKTSLQPINIKKDETLSTIEQCINYLRKNPKARTMSSHALSRTVEIGGKFISHVTWNKAKKEFK